MQLMTRYELTHPTAVRAQRTFVQCCQWSRQISGEHIPAHDGNIFQQELVVPDIGKPLGGGIEPSLQKASEVHCAVPTVASPRAQE